MANKILRIIVGSLVALLFTTLTMVSVCYTELYYILFERKEFKYE
jgi:hypothetical protein